VTAIIRQALLYAFDLLELNGMDLRRELIEVRKATLASILRKSRHGVRLNEHLEHPEGDVVFRHACKMGLEGIVSKRLGSGARYPPAIRRDQLDCAGDGVAQRCQDIAYDVLGRWYRSSVSMGLFPVLTSPDAQLHVCPR
jgi:hypothetical protein